MTVRVARIDFEGGVACERCIVADSFWLRFRGLMGRAELEAGEGMLLVGTGSIQMTFMRFPIDAVFLDEKGTVLKVRASLGPWRIAGCRGAHATLELPAGEASRRGIREGDRLEAVESMATR